MWDAGDAGQCPRKEVSSFSGSRVSMVLFRGCTGLSPLCSLQFKSAFYSAEAVGCTLK